MKTVRLYTPAELKKKYPDGFERALEWFRSDQTEIPWQDEIMDSFKAVFEHSKARVQDWSIDGNYPSSSWVKFEFYSWDYGDKDIRQLKGQRALAWLENNLLDDLRIPNIPMFTRFQLPDGSVTEYQPTRRGELAQYGQYYRPGMIKPCPFTGYCADEDFIESLLKDIKAGCTLEEAYKNLAHVAGKLFESEIEYQNSEEHFLEQDHLTFTKDGRYVYAG